MMGLDNLNSRKISLSLSPELAMLPEVFKTFISHFKLGSRSQIFKPIRIISDPNKPFIQIRWENCSEKNPWISEGDKLLSLLTIQDLKLEVSAYNQRLELWHNQGLMKIGWTDWDLILLGIDGEKADRIYLHGESYDYEKFTEIADNIFQLFSRIELKPSQSSLDFNEIELEDLFMTWGKDYWERLS